jgi:hypothetical protein
MMQKQLSEVEWKQSDDNSDYGFCACGNGSCRTSCVGSCVGGCHGSCQNSCHGTYL